MNRSKLCLVAVGAGLALLFVARPLLGVEEPKGDPKEMAKLMTDAKFTLIKAVEAAEKETKGVAVKAFAEKYPEGVRVDVFCVAGDAVKWVEIDKAGKVLFVKDAADKEAGWGKPEPKEKMGEKDKPAEQPKK